MGLLLLSLLVLHAWAIEGDARSVQGPSRLNTKALRLATGKKIARPNMPPEEMGVDGAYESDMKLTPEQMMMIGNDGQPGGSRYRRKAVAQDQYLWPNNIVAYEFDSDLPSNYRDNIRQAIHHWEDLTCIRFREYSPGVGDDSRVKFYQGAGCQSAIGRIAGGQETSIGSRCNTMGSIAHEIGHVLGFYHEQSRPDRDEHVSVHMENVTPKFQYNFKKYGTSQVRTDEPYDIGSVMHYGSLYYSKDGKSPTILPKEDGVKGFMGQRDGLSFMDVKTANDLYGCAAHCPSSQHCNNMGFMGADCTCMCPWGLTGDTCDEVISSTGHCGGVLTTRDGTFSTPNYPNGYGGPVTCHWLILGPPGSSIKLWFNKFEMEDDEDAPCGYDWVEVRTLGPHLVGPKMCGNGPSTHFEHDSNALYVRFQSDDSYNDFSGFEAGYAIEGGSVGWDPWAPWSACSKACGGGTRIRLRTCHVAKCVGPSMQPEVCNTHTC
ncbi:protein SpAN-like [Haliotis cracherodii]|uniref:protein SpAN-like n=1 Tax=Haliotis cracherodii TaxID=6455 RepID=UPI0039E77902